MAVITLSIVISQLYETEALESDDATDIRLKIIFRMVKGKRSADL